MSDPVAAALDMNRRRRAAHEAWTILKAQIARLPIHHQRYTGMNWDAVRLHMYQLHVTR